MPRWSDLWSRSVSAMMGSVGGGEAQASGLRVWPARLATAALVVLAALVAAIACRSSPPEPSPPPPAPSGDAARGLALIQRYECGRCHDGAYMEPQPRNKHCFRCHQDILAGRFDAPPEAVREWRQRVRHLAFVPSLALSQTHYRRAWIERFLLNPTDLRPHLVPTMPRLALSPSEARDIATAIAPGDEPAVSFRGADAARGRELLDTKGCGACHLFTGVPQLSTTPPSSGGVPSAAVALAPDLRAAREKLRADGLLEWLLDPAAVKPGTQMPDVGLSRSEARDIALYILTAPLDAVKTAPPPARLPILERHVTYDEVSQRVFRKTCWHCHSEPDYAIGEGGPGNTGGFGFKGRGLSLADYDGVASGMLDEHGDRQSVFAPMPDGTPRLLAALLARQVEEAGGSVPGVRGMPLGLPALSPEEIQLVETWIKEGRPE